MPFCHTVIFLYGSQLTFEAIVLAPTWKKTVGASMMLRNLKIKTTVSALLWRDGTYFRERSMVKLM